MSRAELAAIFSVQYTAKGIYSPAVQSSTAHSKHRLES